MRRAIAEPFDASLRCKIGIEIRCDHVVVGMPQRVQLPRDACATRYILGMSAQAEEGTDGRTSIRFDDNCTRMRSSLARSRSRLGRNRERGRDSQGCDEDHGGKCAKALKAGHWTVTSKRKARRVRVALTQANRCAG